MRISDWSSDVCSSDLFAHQGFFFRSVIEETHLFEQTVIFWIFVVRCIFTAVVRLGIGAIKQKQKVLGIGIISNPAPQIHLSATVAHHVLDAVVVGSPYLKLDIHASRRPKRKEEG